MKTVFLPEAMEQLQTAMQTDPKLALRIVRLAREAAASPFKGIGKPEPLKHELQGWWSRRIDDEHRLVYRVAGSGTEQFIEIASCRFHYGRR